MKILKKLIKAALLPLGYEIRKIKCAENAQLTPFELTFNKAAEFVSPYTMLSNTRLHSLFRQAAFCEEHGISGAFVECGVWKGGAVALMAMANLTYGKTHRDIHLFDAFDNICEPDRAVDGERAVAEVQKWAKKGGANGRLEPMDGFYDQFGGAGTLAGNRELLEAKVGYDAEHLYFHKGWFQDTLPVDARDIEKIAILRIDGDWYASTKICLDFLFEKVVSGGFVIIDDYGAYDGCKKAVDEFIAANNLHLFMNKIDDEAIYLIAP